MEVAWVAPISGFLKINVGYASADPPLTNGNSNGVGVIIRNHLGEMLWGAMGPKPGIPEDPATLWSVHAGLMETVKMGKDKVISEISNRELFDIVRHQEFIIVPEELTEALMMFNTLHENQRDDIFTERKLLFIPETQNATAACMAQFGLENMDSFEAVEGLFGNIQHLLDRDMGMAQPQIVGAPAPNFGQGEVVD